MAVIDTNDNTINSINMLLGRGVTPSVDNISPLTLGARADHPSSVSHFMRLARPARIRFAGQRLPYHQNAQTRRARGGRGKCRTNSALRENFRRHHAHG
jgi:hypothetical protein